MGKRIYAAVFGSGLGHITRIMPVVEHFQRLGIDFEFSSFNEALIYLRSKNYKCNAVRAIDAKFDALGRVSSSGTVKAFPTNLGYFAIQVRSEIKNISRFRPDLVFSDSRLSAVIAADYLGVPSITVTNQIKILLPTMYEGKPKFISERINGEVLGLFWALSNEILLPDLPPPYSISDRGLWGIRSASKAKYIGFMIQPRRVEDPEKAIQATGVKLKKPLVFFQVSGPTQTKMALFRLALRASQELQGRAEAVVSLGDPRGSSFPYRQNGAVIFEWCPIKNELFATCDVVVARSGHSTVCQAVLFGKPIVAVPITDHTEQIRNAERSQELGFGKKLTDIDTAHSMADAILSILTDNQFAASALKLMLIAQKYDGTETCKRVVSEYLN